MGVQKFKIIALDANCTFNTPPCKAGVRLIREQFSDEFLFYKKTSFKRMFGFYGRLNIIFERYRHQRDELDVRMQIPFRIKMIICHQGDVTKCARGGQPIFL